MSHVNKAISGSMRLRPQKLKPGAHNYEQDQQKEEISLEEKSSDTQLSQRTVLKQCMRIKSDSC